MVHDSIRFINALKKRDTEDLFDFRIDRREGCCLNVRVNAT